MNDWRQDTTKMYGENIVETFPFNVEMNADECL